VTSRDEIYECILFIYHVVEKLFLDNMIFTLIQICMGMHLFLLILESISTQPQFIIDKYKKLIDSSLRYVLSIEQKNLILYSSCVVIKL